MKSNAKKYFENSKRLFSDQKNKWWKDAVIEMLAEFAEQQLKNCNLQNVMRSFSIEDLRKAFEAGQQQVRAEWDNDTSSSIGYYNGYADDTFESWSEENLNISDVRSSNYSMVDKEGLYKILHEHYATDRYQYRTTIVAASSKEEAMEKLNDYLFTKPDGVYTALPCKNIDDVSILKVLE
jgi:hypothetical protein